VSLALPEALFFTGIDWAAHRGERGKRVHLSTAACRPANGCAARAAAHREAAAQARADIRHSERQQFPVGVDRPIGRPGE